MALNEPHSGGAPGGAERDPRLDRLYREAVREEPPAPLDSAILAAARREVGARPRPIGWFLHAWRVPVSIAAAVVLSVSVVTLMMEEGADRTAEAPPAVPPVAQPSAAPPATDAKPEPRDVPEKQRAVVVPPAATKPAPAPAPRASGPVTGGSVSTEAAAPAAAPAKTAEPFSGAAQEQRQADDAARRPAPPQPKPGPAFAPRADRESAPPASGRVLSAPSPPPAAAPAEAARGSSETRALRRERPLVADPQKAALLRELEQQPPEKWLEKIEELRRRGETAPAEELLAEFKRRFPGHPLPPGRQ